MKRFEYRVENCGVEGYEIYDLCQVRGQDGWELAAIKFREKSSELYFKRELNDRNN